MKNDKRESLKQELKTLSESLFHELKTDEHLTLSYAGEDSLFIRVNQAKIRQASEVNQNNLSMSFISGQRHMDVAFSLTGNLETDLKNTLNHLNHCRAECEVLPNDPYVVFPEAGDNSEEDHFGTLPQTETIAEILLKPADFHDLAGLLASGKLMRSYINSKGQFHWFSTETFSFDYSLYTPSQKAIKAIYAGNHWQDGAYRAHLQQAQKQLAILEKAPRKLSPGKYRIYFAPAAVAELVGLLSWCGLSGSAIMQGNSAFKKLSEGDASLSPLFSLGEDFHKGLVPRFNEFGEVSPADVSLLHKGKFCSALINRRTAQEYNLSSNAANMGESLRSPVIAPGSLKEEQALQRLGTGLYVSNLHYLNWSDLQNGRVTGMTRYGCFWVEKGEIVSPIEDMRFDETLYHFWGNGLENLGEKAVFIPQTSSYGERTLGGTSVPSMLVNDFSLTL